MQALLTAASGLLVGLLLIASCTSKPITPPIPREHTDSVRIGGVAYPTLRIGKQRWTTINYSGPGGIPYGNGTEKAIYGRYYTYAEVRALVLPAGWRLPTLTDWVTLIRDQGIVLEQNQARKQEAVKKLLSTTHWRSLPGTNESGFNAYPTGYISQNYPPQDGDLVELWAEGGESMSIQENSQPYHLLRFYSNDNDPTVRYPVRFVSDN